MKQTKKSLIIYLLYTYIIILDIPAGYNENKSYLSHMCFEQNCG
jgi:hypothetical protein